MSRLISLILLSFLLLPLAGIFYLVLFIVIIENIGYGRRGETAAFMTTGILTWIFIAAYWILLWRRSINWTTQRVNMTLLSFLVAGMAGIIVAAAIAQIERGVAYFAGSAIAPLLWQVATIFIWRENAMERSQRLHRTGRDTIVCPTCGYNMTGLKGTRCPECGSEFTLDEILSAQPGQAAKEIEG